MILRPLGLSLNEESPSSRRPPSCHLCCCCSSGILGLLCRLCTCKQVGGGSHRQPPERCLLNPLHGRLADVACWVNGCVRCVLLLWGVQRRCILLGLRHSFQAQTCSAAACQRDRSRTFPSLWWCFLLCSAWRDLGGNRSRTRSQDGPTPAPFPPVVSLLNMVANSASFFFQTGLVDGDVKMCLLLQLMALFFCQQYSEKEDKYEEEIKVLTDKLKEVRFWCHDLCF